MSSYRSVNVFIEVSRRGSVRTPGKSDAVFETSKFFFFFFFFLQNLILIILPNFYSNGGWHPTWASSDMA